MTKILISIWPALLIDGLIYTINETTQLFAGQGAPIWLYEIFNYGMVLLAGYLAARSSGYVSYALAGGAILWFLWRPLLAVLFALIGLAVGSLQSDTIGTSLLGIMGALVLFSPIALGISAVGGVIARTLKTSPSA